MSNPLLLPFAGHGIFQKQPAPYRCTWTVLKWIALATIPAVAGWFLFTTCDSCPNASVWSPLIRFIIPTIGLVGGSALIGFAFAATRSKRSVWIDTHDILVAIAMAFEGLLVIGMLLGGWCPPCGIVTVAVLVLAFDALARRFSQRDLRQWAGVAGATWLVIALLYALNPSAHAAGLLYLNRVKSFGATSASISGVQGLPLGTPVNVPVSLRGKLLLFVGECTVCNRETIEQVIRLAGARLTIVTLNRTALLEELAGTVPIRKVGLGIFKAFKLDQDSPPYIHEVSVSGGLVTRSSSADAYLHTMEVH